MISTHFRMLDSPTDYDPSEQLGELILTGINAGLDSLHSNKPVLPMLIIAVDDKYDLTAFTDMSVDDAYVAALRHLSHMDQPVDACAFVFPATLEAEGRQHPISVVAVEGSERGATYGFRIIGVPKGENWESAALYEGHAPSMLSTTEGASDVVDTSDERPKDGTRPWWRFW